MKTIPIVRIKECFLFDAESGVLSWVKNPEKKIKSNYDAGYIDAYGYLVIKLDGQLFKAHRLIWALHYGEFPRSQIDHINGIKTDNRISNLREATQSENNMNRAKLKNNTSGATGVYPSRNKWRVRIKANNKRINVGTFDSFDDAVKARRAATAAIHGEFAKVPQCVVKAWQLLS